MAFSFALLESLWSFLFWGVHCSFYIYPWEGVWRFLSFWVCIFLFFFKMMLWLATIYLLRSVLRNGLSIGN
jgi:hypothetical protein